MTENWYPHPAQSYTWRFDAEVDCAGTYTQVPLLLAYAITFHRAQGLTLPCIVANASPDACHEPGMAYLLFSRAPSLDAVHLLEFSSAAIRVNSEVLAFYGLAPTPRGSSSSRPM